MRPSPSALRAAGALHSHPEHVWNLPPQGARDLQIKLASLFALLLTQALSAPDIRKEAQTQDLLLTVIEAAQRLAVSLDGLNRRASSLPFTVRVGSDVRFSANGIARWITARQGR
jgi:hypothetical protein